MSADASPMRSPAAATLSVVLVTCNGARWIAEQAESIADQTRPPDEVLLCDDASDDDTVDLALAALEPLGSRVSILPSADRLGVTANVERGLRAATGDVVVLADQDDIWLPHKLDRIERWAATSPAAAVFSDGWIIDAAGTRTGMSLWDRAGFSVAARRTWDADNLAELLRKPVVTGAAMAMRRRSLSIVLPLPADGWHDYSISLLLAATGGIDALPESLILYRLHGANTAGLGALRRRDRVLSADAHRDNLAQQIRHVDHLLARLEEHGSDDAARRLRERSRVLTRRHALPRPRWRRVPGVLRLVAERGYHRYSQGWGSAARDLLWP